MFDIITPEYGSLKKLKIPASVLAKLSAAEAGDTVEGCTVITSHYSANYPTPSSESGFLANNNCTHCLVFKYQGLFWAVIVSVKPGEHPWVRKGDFDVYVYQSYDSINQFIQYSDQIMGVIAPQQTYSFYLLP